MFIYFLLFALPVSGFVPRMNYGYKKMYVFNSLPKIENIVNENVKDFSTEFVKPKEPIIDEPEPEPETTVTEIVRTGKFVDQDGKSNVWSVDPIIKIDETNKSNIGILLNMMTGLGTVSILVYMLSQVFPDY
jgi:hypothetical protein